MYAHNIKLHYSCNFLPLSTPNTPPASETNGTKLACTKVSSLWLFSVLRVSKPTGVVMTSSDSGYVDTD